VCLDESRVRIKLNEQLSTTNNGYIDDSDINDYVHANFVDGYKQKNAYISTQGPLDATLEEFWRMIWQESVLVVAMTTKVVEQRRVKCAQYWPNEEDETMRIVDFCDIKNVGVQDLDDYRVTKLVIKHLASGQARTIAHCQFMSWPDHGVPKTATHILDFIDLVRKSQRECLKQLSWSGHPSGPPICVHCSAGIGRTGTFCTIDICVNRINDSQPINIEDTVQRIRSQRAQSVQTREQYVFCYLAALEYAQKKNKFRANVELAQLFDTLI
jgi:tyrosine-protein phosphatase non-receptor type 9